MRIPSAIPAPSARLAGSLIGMAWSAAALITGGAIVVAASATYSPGHGLGYGLGVAGGMAMLLLFGYPLRKRVRALSGAGAVRYWFAAHMALGIAGPLMIVLHSRLSLASLNAAVAFWSMVLVASSGVVGRFLYRQVHAGLDGRRESVEALRLRAGFAGDDVRTWLRFLPAVRDVLEQFTREAEGVAEGGLRGWIAMVLLDWRATRARRLAQEALWQDLPIVARVKGWDAEAFHRRMTKAEVLIGRWIREARGVGRFAACERLFALWHVVHLPFVVLLVASAVVHVLYVHMY